MVVRSSGREELDRAAIAVARGVRFTRPLLNGVPVPVRTALPVSFITSTQPAATY
ncbi:TonB family protein [Longimicrobium sp.]|uniref:TonB family protein n=1 Tax=Longimicrobium sp. TaxID=2029185 RepID=UPI002BB88D18|nr:TonB family protein [Longimicrobium sp.]HSU16341.1 TonB family protein [Longimicrobium sp.]